MKYLLTACGQCLLHLLFILWLHKIDMPCSQVSVVAAERTGVVLVFSKKKEDSLITHLSVVLKNLLMTLCFCCFVFWTAYVLLCPALWLCVAKQGSRKWEQLRCSLGLAYAEMEQVWLSLWLRGVSCMSSPACVSVSNLRQPSSCDTFQRCLQEGDKLTLVTLASPWGEKSS